MTAESARNLEIRHLGLFVGDNESVLPQAFFFIFESLELSPSSGQGHSSDSLEMAAALSVLLQWSLLGYL